MKNIKKILYLVILSSVFGNVTVEASWLSWCQVSGAWRSVQGFCSSHQKKILVAAGVIALLAVLYKNRSMLSRPCRFIAQLFKRKNARKHVMPKNSVRLPVGLTEPVNPPLQEYAGVSTAVPTWVTQEPYDGKKAQDWWTHQSLLMPRQNFFEDLVGQDESTFRKQHAWSLKNAFVPKNRVAWLSEHPRRAAIIGWMNDRNQTGLYSLGQLKKILSQPRLTATRTYFSILVYDPYLPWESDIRYLQSIPQNKNAVFQTASTFFGPLEGGMADEDALLGGMFPHAVQGEEAAISAAGGTIWRKYMIPGTPQYLLEQIQDKFPVFHNSAIDRESLKRYRYDRGDEDRVSVFLQDGVPVTGGYGDTEKQGHRGTGRQQRLAVYTWPDGTIDTDKTQVVSQLLTSALCLRDFWHEGHINGHIAGAAKMLLNASYLGACASTAASKKNRLYLTMVGGGAFANPVSWIGRAIAQRQCRDMIKTNGLQVTCIYHPDKIRDDAKVPRDAKTDEEFFDSLLIAYDDVNGTALKRDRHMKAMVQEYLELAYLCKQYADDRGLEYKLHRAAERLNSRLMWQPYSGKFSI